MKIASLCIVLLGFHVSDSAYSGFGHSSRYQPYRIKFNTISCNNSVSSPPVVTHQQNANEYMRPTVLNINSIVSEGTTVAEDENDLDIGNRINSPGMNHENAYTHKNTIPIPYRLISNPNVITMEDQAQKLMDVESQVKFYLFTKANPVVSQELQIHLKTSLNESHFLNTRGTKLIIHGFTDVDAAGQWVNVLKEAYLSSDNDFNVIVADFSAFPIMNLLRSTLPLFASMRLAEFVLWLEVESGAKREDIHLIARSYACHVAGVGGRMLEGRIGRITALEPKIKIAIGGAPEYRLNKDDGLFVDVIHVNGQRYFFHGSQFGLSPPSGHVDIYPNTAEKGLGCPGESHTLRRFSFRFCQLGRGVRYFTNSIRYPSSYPMCACYSFESYKAGQCSCSQPELITFMGESLSNQTRGVFQLAPEPQKNTVFQNTGFYNLNLGDLFYRG